MSMPNYVVSKITDALNAESKSLRGARVLALGVAFKKDINDARNSPAVKVVDELVKKGAEVVYHDPFIKSLGNGSEYFRVESGLKLRSQTLSAKLLREQDCTVILVDHECFNIPFIVRNSSLIVDTKNVTKNVKCKITGKIVKI